LLTHLADLVSLECGLHLLELLFLLLKLSLEYHLLRLVLDVRLLHLGQSLRQLLLKISRIRLHLLFLQLQP